MPPWVTAAASTFTLRLMTTVPVREFTTTRAGGDAGSTSKFSIIDKKATRWLISAGAKMRVDTASKALAVPGPKVSLIELAKRRLVVKSEFFRFSTIYSLVEKGVSTIFSTLAPDGIRPTVGTLTVSVVPAPPAVTPLTAKAP